MENTINKRESNTYLDRVNDLLDEMDNNFTEASQKVSMCDLQQEDILHYIEFYGDKLSVKKKTELFDLLFEVRSARREAKSILGAVRLATEKLKIGSVKKRFTTKDTIEYRYRTEILDDFVK